MPTYKPLAEILRPSSLADFVGQRHLLDVDKPIGKTLADGKLHSMILWGPPGSGKTTLASIICRQMGAYFEQMSAVLEGIKELRNVLDHAQRYQQHNKSTVLFVDEIHRFNKAPIPIVLKDASIATSGNYRNYFIWEGRKYMHIFNPSTGLPANNDLSSATVVHPQSAISDAYATAMMAMGSMKAIELANKLKLTALLITIKEDNNQIIKINLP